MTCEQFTTTHNLHEGDTIETCCTDTKIKQVFLGLDLGFICNDREFAHCVFIIAFLSFSTDCINFFVKFI